MILVSRINGFSRVAFAPVALERFARHWPCFGEVKGALAFTFARNGDLIDLEGDDSGLDPAGVAALADDAKALAGLAPLEPNPWMESRP
jgi:hypothetical protein